MRTHLARAAVAAACACLLVAPALGPAGTAGAALQKNPDCYYGDTPLYAPPEGGSPYTALCIGPIGRIPAWVSEDLLRMDMQSRGRLLLDILALLADANPPNEVCQYMRAHPEYQFFFGQFTPRDRSRPFSWAQDERLVLVTRDGRVIPSSVVAIEHRCQEMDGPGGRPISMAGCRALWLQPGDGLQAPWDGLLSVNGRDEACRFVAGFAVQGLTKKDVDHLYLTREVPARTAVRTGR